MEKRFFELWERLGGKINAKEEFSKLLAMYAEPQRHYHTLNHIKKCLLEFDLAKHLISNPDAVEFAIWYHDIIYIPRFKDNEEKSAQFAYDVCVNAKLSKEFAEKVKNLILATKHNVIPKDTDTKFLLDIDLSSLGGSTEELDENERNIRQEYYFSSNEVYMKGREVILRGFLDRDRIYLTDFFRDKYEEKTRKNITAALDNLINLI
jgi:predicted metal-dependent HD superfamily phosphohydrolase